VSRYVLDTGIVLGFLRGAPYARHVIDTYDPLSPPNLAVQSVVSVAELESLGFKNKWGQQKLDKLDELVRKIPIQDINHPAILRKFSEIDAYQENKHPSLSIPSGKSGFKLGDNDIWIAATASAMQAVILTTDKDFLPLNNVFATVIYIDPNGCK
jgi:predicted nucleic acid-binding protein